MNVNFEIDLEAAARLANDSDGRRLLAALDGLVTSCHEQMEDVDAPVETLRQCQGALQVTREILRVLREAEVHLDSQHRYENPGYGNVPGQSAAILG